MGGMTVIERDFVPIGHYRLPGPGRDGVARRRSEGLARLLHYGDEPVYVHARVTGGAVRIRSQGSCPVEAAWGLDRMRFALALDHDLRPFHRAFRNDPLIGPAIRRRPWSRPRRMADPFQALSWAITEQLIEAERAFEIQRRLVWRYGRHDAGLDLRDSPSPAAIAARSAPELEACDLSHGRSLAMIRAAREVQAGRVDLDQHEPAWARLRKIREVGSWTLEKLAVHGQGRDDQLPAGDLAYIKLVGRLARLGRRATEQEVREFFAPYAPFTALAGLYALIGPGNRSF
ncbi:MAG: DNA-3-methyladenine glycosylase [Thermoleophilaceae bacterium]|jgi:3-methyladenine DNA glycosylase/8-oxoguanine DNA glycosylase|nr:DNA-3-methyladenine glycosylase [Thermoleophilaceae bacterium]